MNSQSDQLPDGLIAQLVDHCIGIASRRCSRRLVCEPKTCRLLGWRCGDFQIADPLLTSGLPKRVGHESKPHVQQVRE